MSLRRRTPRTVAPAAGPSIRAAVDIRIRLENRNRTVPARLFTFSGLRDRAEHVALGLGRYERPSVGAPLVRVHSECLTGDLFGSPRCDCGFQLAESLGRIAAAGGYLLYLRQEGRGVGLYSKIDSYVLQDLGMDTFEANRALGYRDDERDYEVAAQMLCALGAQRIDLITNNPDKTQQLTARGVVIRERIPTSVFATAHNGPYLAAKLAAGHELAANMQDLEV